MTESEARAAQRRLAWSGEVVLAGTPKGPRTASLTAEERIAALAALNVRAWLATGRPWPEPVPRGQWVGEVYRLP